MRRINRLATEYLEKMAFDKLFSSEKSWKLIAKISFKAGYTRALNDLIDLESLCHRKNIPMTPQKIMNLSDHEVGHEN